jgi:hypothetical protein
MCVYICMYTWVNDLIDGHMDIGMGGQTGGGMAGQLIGVAHACTRVQIGGLIDRWPDGCRRKV